MVRGGCGETSPPEAEEVLGVQEYTPVPRSAYGVRHPLGHGPAGVVGDHDDLGALREGRRPFGELLLHGASQRSFIAGVHAGQDRAVGDEALLYYRCAPGYPNYVSGLDPDLIELLQELCAGRIAADRGEKSHLGVESGEVCGDVGSTPGRGGRVEVGD